MAATTKAKRTTKKAAPKKKTPAGKTDPKPKGARKTAAPKKKIRKTSHAEKMKRLRELMKDADPYVAEVAEKLFSLEDPRAWPEVLQEMGALCILGKVAQDMVKTLAYLHQNWQSAFTVSQNFEKFIKSKEDEVYISKMVKGKPLRSRLDEAKEYPELWPENEPPTDALH